MIPFNQIDDGPDDGTRMSSAGGAYGYAPDPPPAAPVRTSSTVRRNRFDATVVADLSSLAATSPLYYSGDHPAPLVVSSFGGFGGGESGGAGGGGSFDGGGQ